MCLTLDSALELGTLVNKRKILVFLALPKGEG